MPSDDPTLPASAAAPVTPPPGQPAAAAPPEAPAPGGSSPVADRVGPDYRKLPGRMATFRLGNYGLRKLYLGPDHLLQVETVFYVEHFRRFAYADIQAILVRQTSKATVLSIVLAVFIAACGALAWILRTDEAGLVFWLGAAGFFGLLLLVNLVRGATCRCQLQTAIGPQPLLSLNRLRTVRKALPLLTARIHAAQGALSANEAAARVDEQLSKHRLA